MHKAHHEMSGPELRKAMEAQMNRPGVVSKGKPCCWNWKNKGGYLLGGLNGRS